jgi:3-oxoacyl-[acyl-carrier protein] reductase
MARAKTILITGTSRGIGRHMVEYYTGKGYRVAGCSRSPSPFKLKDYFHYEIDVSDERKVKQMVLDVEKKLDSIDILINNAGVASMNHFILTPLATVTKLLEINLIGTFLFSREAAKIMMRNKWGRIINFTTVAVPLSLEGESIYVASKSAVEGLTKTLARELAPFDITCNAIGPAPVNTDLIKNVPQEKIKKLVESLPIKRLGKFEDILNIADFFMSEKSSSVTGQIIYLGGA